ncbi:MAG: hypothetical protein EVJ47_05770 [Candidatus Acidulodesulfobacterium ferriphilum]|jgi:hypothetical protein|uniref:Calcineurin-like phosphoesterase domain-containing protein n=1 Tax=Candidatus Acidulodesulfobacterium ferriphilum TaxID=2597223 RepID=A0A519BBL5_9DELT|nr:MAG: hypothetical protein EVJ47_05770 [Candidatus Acidulodesulfobacterium ferriphilum]
MNICVAGDVHGRIDKFYENIRDFELKLKISFDVVLQVGDFGIWIDEKNHDGITKLHGGTGDFPKWHKGKRAVPIKTYFINGNNEDFNFLEAVKLSGDFEILKNLFYVPNGTVADIKAGTGMAAYKSGKDASLNGGNTENLVVAGIGGKYDPEYFNHREADRYYTKYEIDNLIKHANGNIDIFISHDAPEGVLIEDNDKKRYYPKAAGLRELILKIKPKIVFFGHHHGVCKSEIEGIPVYGLNVLGEKDSLLGFKIKNGAIKILGKY